MQFYHFVMQAVMLSQHGLTRHSNFRVNQDQSPVNINSDGIKGRENITKQQKHRTLSGFGRPNSWITHKGILLLLLFRL